MFKQWKLTSLVCGSMCAHLERGDETVLTDDGVAFVVITGQPRVMKYDV